MSAVMRCRDSRAAPSVLAVMATAALSRGSLVPPARDGNQHGQTSTPLSPHCRLRPWHGRGVPRSASACASALQQEPGKVALVVDGFRSDEPDGGLARHSRQAGHRTRGSKCCISRLSGRRNGTGARARIAGA